MTSPLDRLRKRLEESVLYLVTPARPVWGPLDEFLAVVLDGGVDIVQLREKQIEAGPLLEFCATVRRRTEEYSALFVVNDRVDVALAAGADGVHLGQDDLPPAEARRQAGRGLLIGLSTHNEDQVRAAGQTEADYIAVGPVYQTPTHPGRPATGQALVRFAAAHVERPWFAIGGIDEMTLPEVASAGAHRVSVVRALVEAEDPGAVAHRMREELTRA